MVELGDFRTKTTLQQCRFIWIMVTKKLLNEEKTNITEYVKSTCIFVQAEETYIIYLLPTKMAISQINMHETIFESVTVNKK